MGYRHQLFLQDVPSHSAPVSLDELCLDCQETAGNLQSPRLALEVHGRHSWPQQLWSGVRLGNHVVKPRSSQINLMNI